MSAPACIARRSAAIMRPTAVRRSAESAPIGDGNACGVEAAVQPSPGQATGGIGDPPEPAQVGQRRAHQRGAAAENNPGAAHTASIRHLGLPQGVRSAPTSVPQASAQRLVKRHRAAKLTAPQIQLSLSGPRITGAAHRAIPADLGSSAIAQAGQFGTTLSARRTGLRLDLLA